MKSFATHTLLAIGIALGIASSGWAVPTHDVIFDASGTFVDLAGNQVGVLSGTLTIDTQLGQVLGGDLAVTTPTDTFLFIGTDPGNDFSAGFLMTNVPDGHGNFANFWAGVGFSGGDDNFPDASLNLNIYLGPGFGQQIPSVTTSPLVGYQGGALCDFDLQAPGVAGNCGGAWYSSFETDSDPFLINGNLTAETGTPEPSALFLLPVPAIWILARRRFAKPQA